MANYLSQKTVFEFDSFDPRRNLWRNVLVVAIEDGLKEAYLKLRLKNYPNRRYANMDYFTIPNPDFAFVCQQAGLNHYAIRRNVKKLFEDIEKQKPVNLPWKRLSTTSPKYY